MVVLRGEGRSFCADNDLKAIAAGELAPTPHFQAETIEALEALSQAVIVSVRGHCFTGGLELALASDLIIASDTAMFSDTHGRFAMVPTWGMTIRHEKAMMVETVGMSPVAGATWERANGPGRGPDSAERVAEFHHRG